MRLVHGSGATGLQLVQSVSDSDEDSDGAWEGRLGHRYDPPGKDIIIHVNLFNMNILIFTLKSFKHETKHVVFRAKNVQQSGGVVITFVSTILTDPVIPN